MAKRNANYNNPDLYKQDRLKEDNLTKWLSANTLVARFVSAEDLRGLPANQVDVLFDSDVTFKAYLYVPVLPLPADAIEGTFYILPDDSLNFCINGVWHAISGSGGGGRTYTFADTATGWRVTDDLGNTYNHTDKDSDTDTTYTFADRTDGVQGWKVDGSDGTSYVYEDKGEDNVIEIIKKSDGTALTINPADKSVTLPDDDDTTYTFALTSTGWQVTNDKTGAVVFSYTDKDTTYAFADTTDGWKVDGSDGSTYSHTDLGEENVIEVVKLNDGTPLTVDPSDKSVTLPAGTASDGTYFTNATLNTSIRGTTTVASSTVTGLTLTDVVPGETLLYDGDGTVAVVTGVSGTNLTAITITTGDSGDTTPFVLRSSSSYNLPALDAEATITLADLTQYDGTTAAVAADLVEGKTFVFDGKGKIAIVSSVVGTTYKLRTITQDIAGHTIYDDTDSQMTQRDGLQFVNLKVTDDSANNETDVEVDKITNADIDTITAITPEYAGTTDYYITRPFTWPVNTLVDFGGGIYGVRFQFKFNGNGVTDLMTLTQDESHYKIMATGGDMDNGSNHMELHGCVPVSQGGYNSTCDANLMMMNDSSTNLAHIQMYHHWAYNNVEADVWMLFLEH